MHVCMGHQMVLDMELLNEVEAKNSMTWSCHLENWQDMTFAFCRGVFIHTYVNLKMKGWGEKLASGPERIVKIKQQQRYSKNPEAAYKGPVLSLISPDSSSGWLQS